MVGYVTYRLLSTKLQYRIYRTAEYSKERVEE